MAIPDWKELTKEQKEEIGKDLTQKEWDGLSQEARHKYVIELLFGGLSESPAANQELPKRRKWTLPKLPDALRKNREETQK